MNSAERLRLAGVIKDNLFIGPRKVSFHVTNICNLRCIYCWYHSVLKRGGKVVQKKKELSFDIFKAVVDDASDLKTDWIQISSQGEPTLHPRIKDMVEYVKGKKLKLSLITNGTFGEELLDSFRNVDVMRVDLSASDALTYRKIHSPSSKNLFRQVLRNLSFFSMLRKRHKRSPSIEINYILTSQNYQGLPSFFKLLQDKAIDCFKIRNIDADDTSRPMTLTKDMLKKIHQFVQQKIRNSAFRHTQTKIEFEHERAKDVIAGKDATHIQACYNGWYYAFVNLNGDVTPCCKLKNNLITGNIYKQSFRDIWTSQAFQRIRLQGKYSLYDRRFDACENCCFYILQHEVHRQARHFQILK